MSVPRDHDAIEALYEELGPALLAYARSIVHDPAAAEDALQQVFVKLMSAPDATLPREPRPYLFRAVRNTCLNRRRSQGREAAHRDPPAMFAGPPPRSRSDRVQTGTPEFTSGVPEDLNGLARDLEDALRELPEEQREVVVLRVWGEMTLDEAAAVLGIPANTVASRYRYALAKLRQRFGAHL